MYQIIILGYKQNTGKFAISISLCVSSKYKQNIVYILKI